MTQYHNNVDKIQKESFQKKNKEKLTYSKTDKIRKIQVQYLQGWQQPHGPVFHNQPSLE